MRCRHLRDGRERTTTPRTRSDLPCTWFAAVSVAISDRRHLQGMAEPGAAVHHSDYREPDPWLQPRSTVLPESWMELPTTGSSLPDQEVVLPYYVM